MERPAGFPRPTIGSVAATNLEIQLGLELAIIAESAGLTVEELEELMNKPPAVDVIVAPNHWHRALVTD